ncbi:hypothetical protein SESBI_31498 [Sesbania bispinosa]|nr:hypothetical protein SESBI_31498 [Sesbania bispinosa]
MFSSEVSGGRRWPVFNPRHGAHLEDTGARSSPTTVSDNLHGEWLNVTRKKRNKLGTKSVRDQSGVKDAHRMRNSFQSLAANDDVARVTKDLHTDASPFIVTSSDNGPRQQESKIGARKKRPRVAPTPIVDIHQLVQNASKGSLKFNSTNMHMSVSTSASGTKLANSLHGEGTSTISGEHAKHVTHAISQAMPRVPIKPPDGIGGKSTKSNDLKSLMKLKHISGCRYKWLEDDPGPKDDDTKQGSVQENNPAENNDMMNVVEHHAPASENAEEVGVDMEQGTC